jgi:class 3 adenylate cyclase
MREFLERFAKTHQIIRFDARGLGLSDRSSSERTLDAHLRDVDAVISKMRLERFAIFAASYAGPMGLRYAALHPEQVTRLILWCTHAAHADVVAKLPAQLNQQRQAVNQLAGVDRELYIRTYLHRAVGWTEGDTANRFVEVAKQSIDPDHFFENLANHAAFDASADLEHVGCPTLVMHRPAFVGSHVDVAKGLAARMPNARLLLLEGDSIAPFIGDTTALLENALGFLDEDIRAGIAAGGGDGAMRTILYSDIEAHSTMMQRLGDVRGREVLREHERLIREALRAHGGAEVKTFGDGFLASFVSTQMALRCAIALERAFDQMPEVHGERLKVRVGINAGEPIAEGDDLYGHSVTVASQLAKAANGGEILVSLVVRELVAGKGFQFERRGTEQIGDEELPMEIYRVEWREAVPG